jgi:pimeloyl-ACP methyl ester carboxylesterase
VLAALAALVASPPSAVAADTTLEQPPPRLTTPRATLAKAVSCSQRARTRRTVLLVHGTGSTPHESWSWSYSRALRADGFGVCTVRLPHRATGSFTRAAEYVVFAARRAAQVSGRRIAIVGHSQGGALAVWVTKFWPDVARRTEDVVSIAGPLDGTALANELCTAGECAPLAWQLRRGARTVAAMRRAPLPENTDITALATRYDEVVRPQPQVNRMRGARSIIVQDVCPADPVEHGLILGDPVTYALTLDALRHRGAARPARIPASTCQQTFIPHGDPAGAVVFARSPLMLVLGVMDPRRWVDAEPPLPPYARRYAG